jgi:hypothetical protein
VKKKITVVVCDLCGKEVEESSSREGVIHLDTQEDLKFDLCWDDIQNHFADHIEPSPRRGRKAEAAA